MRTSTHEKILAHAQHIAWVRGIRAAEDAVWSTLVDAESFPDYLSFDSKLTWQDRLTKLAKLGKRAIREQMVRRMLDEGAAADADVRSAP